MKCQKDKACVKQPEGALPDSRPRCTGCDTQTPIQALEVVRRYISSYPKTSAKVRVFRAIETLRDAIERKV